ncbi:NADH-quinone oxidoreductase subunit L [Candidatus Villigracilis affinis]|uniref:NADH-quinone oxidoreductase subunit 5 family protein n=1 Tax=Candidatus Villigracilis affinis TaxID=3140682 RepID=UPI002A21FBA6|nr:NADH-quinone oxidoreductase subunit L [Anaerolineales bacterium]
MANILILLIIGFPWLGALIVWLTGDARPKTQHTLAVAFSLLSGISSLILLAFINSQPAIDLSLGTSFGNLTFTPDGLAVSLTVIATVVGSLAVLFSVDYMLGEAQLGRYYFMVLFFIGAMAGLVLSGNLLFTFFFWEITALCSYGLISFYNDDPKAVAGGIKALIITQVGGVGLLAGALISYANLGSFQISELLGRADTIPTAALSFIAFSFLVAAAAKSAQFPFHTWLPDAMEAPTPISALIHAATMVNAGIYLLARFYPAFESVPGWKTAVVLVGVTSALITAFMALTATDLKRALAYSTVSQLGYMVYAIGAGGVLASQFHLFSHAVFKALLFLTAGSVIHSVGTRDMRRMGGLGAKMPFARNVFIIGALALAGIPIFNGFWSKELILEVGLEHSPMWAYALMLLGAGLTAFYTFRMTWMVFFGTPREALHIHPIGIAMKISLAVLSIGTFTTWLLFGGLNGILSASLPFHEIEAESTLEMIKAVSFAPATWFALLVVTLGLGLFFAFGRKFALSESPAWLSTLTESSFGFEPVNRFVVSLVSNGAEKLRATQTGQLNWNILAIVGALLVVLAALVWGGAL